MADFSGLRMVEQTSQQFWDRIREGKVYSHIRYGDGEWAGMLGRAKPKSRNCDKHQYFPGMVQDLRQILSGAPTEPLLLGMQHFGFRMFRPRILRWLEARALSDLSWYDADTLAMHRVSGNGNIQGYFEALATKQVLMVGPCHLQALKKKGLVDFAAHVVTPMQDAYKVLDDIHQKILKAYSQLEPPVVVSISCGLPAGILVDRLFREIGTESFIFDAGSVYDVYCGVSSRKYMKALQHKWQEGKGNAPHRIRASMEEGAARRDMSVREVSCERKGDSE